MLLSLKHKDRAKLSRLGWKARRVGWPVWNLSKMAGTMRVESVETSPRLKVVANTGDNIVAPQFVFWVNETGLIDHATN